MRKLLAVMLLLLMATCVAFAEEDGGESGQQTTDPFDINKVEMSLDQTVFYKTGSAITVDQVLTMTYDGAPLVETLYPYTLQYSNNINVGTATVTAYFTNEDKSKSLNFEILPAKPGTASITGVQSSRPDVYVSWSGVGCTGYLLEVATNSSYSKPAQYWLTTNSYRLGGLQNGTTYYFRVSAYNTENGKTTYGDWSTASSKVNTTGQVGNRYSLNGVMISNMTVKDGNDYFYYNASGIKSGCDKKMWDKVKNTKSKTKYLIAVDCSKNRTCVYKGKKGKWNLLYYWPCSTGKAKTPTIKGKFKVRGKVSHFGESHGYSCWYATKIKYEYYFHSVLYQPYSKTNIKNGRLGANISKGCIRLQMSNAKWIYKNCKKNTTIIIY